MKINKTEYIKGFDLEYNGDENVDILGLIEGLNILLEKGATHIQFFCSCPDGYLEEISLNPYIIEEETDEEYEERLLKIKRENEYIKLKFEIKERNIYERLKLKYDK